MDITAMFKLSYGLYIIGVKDGDKSTGCVVNTVTQVTAEPVQIVIAMNKDNHTHDVLMKSKRCTVSILSQNVPMTLIGQFGFQCGRDVNKFDGVSHKFDNAGAPYVTEGTVAWLGASLTQTVDVGSHTLFIMTVDEGENLSVTEPMTYSYYHQVKNGKSPKNAPTYVAEEATAKGSGWRCSICGYIYEGDEVPDAYLCPICNQPKSVFVKA